VHVEHRSFAKRGIERAPTVHVGKLKSGRQGGLKSLFMKAVKMLSHQGRHVRAVLRI